MGIETLTYDVAVEEDLKFLRAWEKGFLPELNHYLRVRQIRKGNPILIAERKTKLAAVTHKKNGQV